MERLLRHSEPAIDELLAFLRLNRTEVHGALTKVQPRNDAAHGRSIDIGTAEAIRADWLKWGGLPGGIFGAILKGD